MGSLLDFRGATQAREDDPTGSYGLVIELVDRRDPARAKGRHGVIHIGPVATVCVVEEVPVVGDLIRGEVPGIVEEVRITRHGRVLIYARPVPTPRP